MHEFEVEQSEVVLDAPIIGVRRDVVSMPGGVTAAREIVEHFGAVAVVAVDSQRRIAMVRQYRHSVGRRLWELPAGLLDIYSEDALVCAQRELAEEAGLAAAQWSLLLDLMTSPGFAEEAVRVYLASDLCEVPRGEAEYEEADMVLEWVPIDDAQSMVLRGDIVNSIAIAGVMAAARMLAGEAEPRDVTEPFDLRPSSLAERRAAQGVTPDMKRI